MDDQAHNPWDAYPTLGAYLDAGGDPNVVCSWGWRLLHHAAEHQDVDLMSRLVAMGADLEARNDQGWTPLHHAIDSDIDGAIQQEEPIDFVGTRRLIALGASLSAVDLQGYTPRDRAGRYGANAQGLFDEMVRQFAR